MSVIRRIACATALLALVGSWRLGPGDEGRGPALVDLRRRIGGGEGVRRPVHGGGRHLGRHRDRRWPERPHRRHQPDRRRQSADRDAVQHRQAVRRAGRQRAAAATSTSWPPRASGARCCRRRSSTPPPATASSTPCRSTSTARTGSGTTTKVFADAGIAEPKTWPEVLAAAQKLKAKGIIPLGPGRPALAGADCCSTRCWSATAAPSCSTSSTATTTPTRSRAPKFKQVAELFKQLQTSVDPGSPGRNWNDATAMVITGKAGDAGHGRLGQGRVHRRRAQTAGKEYGCAVVGRGRLSDGRRRVRLPEDQRSGSAARRRSSSRRVMLDPETQIAFNTKKGSVPVRARRRRLQHGRLRADGRRSAARIRRKQVPTHRLPDLARSVRRAGRRHHPVLEQSGDDRPTSSSPSSSRAMQTAG